MSLLHVGHSVMNCVTKPFLVGLLFGALASAVGAYSYRIIQNVCGTLWRKKVASGGCSFLRSNHMGTAKDFEKYVVQFME